jgi:UDP-glucuronate decarboxylase
MELTVSDLVRRVLTLTGSKSEVVHLPLPVDDPRRRKPDIGRAQAILGWEPKVELQAGLESTAAWFGEEQRLASRKPAARRPPAAASREIFSGVAAE